jgi:hypothetical protein
VRCVAMTICLFALSLGGGCTGAPQLGGDERCMDAADALWTAVNSRQSELIDRAADEIARLRDDGVMPPAAAETLAEIIAAARQGQWSGSRDALRRFIRAQRRSVSS